MGRSLAGMRLAGLLMARQTLPLFQPHEPQLDLLQLTQDIEHVDPLPEPLLERDLHRP